MRVYTDVLGFTVCPCVVCVTVEYRCHRGWLPLSYLDFFFFFLVPQNSDLVVLLFGTKWEADQQKAEQPHLTSVRAGTMFGQAYTEPVTSVAWMVT